MLRQVVLQCKWLNCVKMIAPRFLKSTVLEVKSRMILLFRESCAAQPRHILHETTSTSHRLACLFCTAHGKESQIHYVCIACDKCFHVNCFAAYHFHGAFREGTDITSAIGQANAYAKKVDGSEAKRCQQ